MYPYPFRLGSLVAALTSALPESPTQRPTLVAACSCQLCREAAALGYTEPDPRDDLSGLDVARKALILARLMGSSIELDQVLTSEPTQLSVWNGVGMSRCMAVVSSRYRSNRSTRRSLRRARWPTSWRSFLRTMLPSLRRPGLGPAASALAHTPVSRTRPSRRRC